MRCKCLTVGIAVLVALSIWQVRASQNAETKKENASDPAELRRHGDYLVSHAILCADCHTPQDKHGQPDSSRPLQGATLGFAPKEKVKDWAEKAPDITASGLAGKWSEEELTRFLMTGINPNGEKARVPMPAFRLNARDARAVALYLKSLSGAKRREESSKANKNRE